MPGLLRREKPPFVFEGGLPHPTFENGMTGRGNRSQGSDRARQCDSVATINNKWYLPFHVMGRRDSQ
jgi:hypothetical protein